MFCWFGTLCCRWREVSSGTKIGDRQLHFLNGIWGYSGGCRWDVRDGMGKFSVIYS